MTAEDVFKQNCGPDIKYNGTMTFDHERRREFTFWIGDRLHAIGVNDIQSKTDAEVGLEGAHLAKLKVK